MPQPFHFYSGSLKEWEVFFLYTGDGILRHTAQACMIPGGNRRRDLTASPALMPEEEWYDVDVITCAAPNLRHNVSNSHNPGDGKKPVRIKDKQLQEIHEKRLRRILDVALMEGAEAVILGAFGCGAFRNNPRTVATAAAMVLPDYLHAFRNIEFAVYCRPEDDSNYKAFRSLLGRYMKNG